MIGGGRVSFTENRSGSVSENKSSQVQRNTLDRKNRLCVYDILVGVINRLFQPYL
jgi:hypothetical protein